MSEDVTQISAFIARETKEQLDRYVRETGAKKGRVIDDALESYLATLDDVPAEYVVPRNVTLSRESFESVRRLMDEAEPTQALRDAMHKR